MVVLALAAAVAGYLGVLSFRVDRESRLDQARPSDVIIVMGAAEYSGKPSPVLKRRLDHAVDLYRKRMAPYIMTTGGPGGDPSFTEGGVGRSYLMAQGVPAEAIIVEDESDSTAWSLSAASEILRRMDLRTCIVVSDGYHIFRTRRILQQQGFQAVGSPWESGETKPAREWWRCFRQAVGYGLWKIGVRV
jgi:uncharacterized SAM-binding protein YcdF (DUF218 family)